MKRYKVIVNPISGRGNGERSLPFIKNLLDQYSLSYDLACTEYPGHAIGLAQQAAMDGYAVVVAAGGDGTANEVLNGLMQARQAGAHVTLGVLSVGRGNDFAFGAGIPHALGVGSAVLAADHRRFIDVGYVEGGLVPQGRYFGNGVGIGFDAVVGFEALKLKRLSGFPSYIVAALKTVFLYYRAPRLRITYDDQVLTQPSLMVSVMNGRRMGGGFMMAPNASPDDGFFDLCLAAHVNRARIFPLILRFMQGTQATHPAIRTGRAQHVTVTALEGVLPAHADGETISVESRELTMRILPRQLEVVCAEAA
ncbi:MAG TPA: diacylglycerol kinase family lipid kinase [Anaerolineae bacterium]|nr:diacylglycerol kinase family lipid kinase [Anaerolineae bacterium]HQK15536.1 diacylglycerol kinase family lipid kinase [Anaerolineae bacterium]